MTSRNIHIIGNYIADDTSPYNFGGKGSSKDWIIRDNYFGKPRMQKIPGDIKVDNLVVKNNKKKTWFTGCMKAIGYTVLLFF